ncbi:protein saal1 [Chelonus insularis]|uniref:protein saal1 n=1 Tax=Chelonus insularis TaxID=460826 RepID=UPI00158B4E65|nr:protein saal1 [Chelonus insularis]
MENNSSEDNQGVPVIESQDINSDEQSIIRGDNIGDSTYSARWTLNTLLSLSKIDEQEWSEEFETDLCYLWDMATEKDVMFFLMQNNFFSIAENIFRTSEERRLLEIIAGIISNMCSQNNILEKIGESNDFVDSILDLLSCDDSGVLIQVVRILQAAAWGIQKNESSKWREHMTRCEILGDSLTFILKSSTNSILLTGALKLVQSISIVELSDNTIFLQQLFDVNPLLLALVEALNQLIPTEEENDTSEQQDIIEIWLDVLSNILHDESSSTPEIYDSINKIFVKILSSKEHNLTSLEESTALCIQECVEIIQWFQDKKFKTDVKLVSVIAAIMYKLNIIISSNQNSSTVRELLGYLQMFWLDIYEEYEETKTKINELWEFCSREVRDYLINYTLNGTSL